MSVEVVPDEAPPPAAPALPGVLDPDDEKPYLRWRALIAQCNTARESAAHHATLHNAAAARAADLGAKADALMAPLRGKYGVGDGDEIDDETFAIKRKAKAG